MADIKDEVNDKIIKQVDFYFGDINLPRDRFIKEECSKNDGWMPIETLLKFNRVKSLLDKSDIKDQIGKIAEALAASVIVEVDQEGKKIRRDPTVPLPDGNNFDRTVYLKGFDKNNTTLDELLDYFNSKYKGVEGIIKRTYNEKTLEDPSLKTEEPATEIKKDEGEVKEEKAEVEAKKEENGSTEVKKEKTEEKKLETAPTNKIFVLKKFKGSIFVIFKTVEEAKVLLDEPETVYKGSTLLKMTQNEYKKKKLEEYKEREQKRNKFKGGHEEDGENAEEEDKFSIPKGVLLRLKNVPDGIYRDEIKKQWYSVVDEEKFKVAYVDNQKGETNVILRLDRENAAVESIELLTDKKLTIGDNLIEYELLPEEDEKAYIDKMKADRANKFDRKRKFPGGRGGGGGRGRGRGKKARH